MYRKEGRNRILFVYLRHSEHLKLRAPISFIVGHKYLQSMILST